MLAMRSAFRAKDRVLKTWRAADPYHAAATRRVSAARLAPTSGQVVTQIQAGSSPPDSPVRVLYAQPASAVSVTHVQAAAKSWGGVTP